MDSHSGGFSGDARLICLFWVALGKRSTYAFRPRSAFSLSTEIEIALSHAFVRSCDLRRPPFTACFTRPRDMARGGSITTLIPGVTDVERVTVTTIERLSTTDSMHAILFVRLDRPIDMQPGRPWTLTIDFKAHALDARTVSLNP